MRTWVLSIWVGILAIGVTIRRIGATVLGTVVPIVGMTGEGGGGGTKIFSFRFWTRGTLLKGRRYVGR